MRIDQLPVASTIGNTDTLPFSDGGITKQISVGNLTNSIRDNVYGAPLTASTSSAMTDTSRVYVYTGTTGGGFTNGHWYYYNGSAWTDGGIYNSVAVQTDPTLTLEGVPADAKATGELKTVIDDKLAEFDVAIETFYPHDGYNGPMVTVEGTVDAPPAELVIYGKSVQGFAPSPSTPKEIMTAGENGSIEMRSTNGSLFDPTFLLGASGWSVNGNVYSGDAYDLWQQFNNTHWVPHVPSETRLTISGRASIPSAVSYPRFVFNYADGTSSNVNLTASSEFAIFSGTSEVGKDVDYITFTYSGSTSATMSLTDLRISIGTTDSGRDYIAPAVSAIPTPNGLPGIQGNSGWNYTDTYGQQWLCDTIDLEAGTYTKRCGIVTFDGQSASGWERVNADGGRYRFRNTSYTSTIMRATTNDDVVSIYCTHYLESSANATWTNSNLNGIAVDTGGNIFIADAFLTWGGTLEQFLAQFQTTPMTIVYPLATPEVNQLTEAQIAALRALRGRKGQTVMYSTDPVSPEFLAEIYIDIPTYIQSLLSQMDRGFNVAAVNNGLEFTSIE